MDCRLMISEHYLMRWPECRCGRLKARSSTALKATTSSGAWKRAVASRAVQANPSATKATSEGGFTDGKDCGNLLGCYSPTDREIRDE
ncbi:unnamed protein product [Linum trigynum]|uniref:Uncharacterized protein n=1 Tax=Linum trigynum TaxID=586398 RepID=A0AAV2E0V1_9ROSI